MSAIAGLVVIGWTARSSSHTTSPAYTPQATIACLINKNVVKLRVTDFGKKGGVITDTIDRNIDTKGVYVRHLVKFTVDGIHVDLDFGRPIKRTGGHDPYLYSVGNVDLLWYTGSPGNPTPKTPLPATRRKVDGCLH